MTDYTILPEWAYAYTGSILTGDIKTQPDDFIVTESLTFSPSGSGEHAFLFIEKCGENTEYIARLLARHAGVRQRDVSFAGLKDRHGRTRQWFSVWLPGQQDPDWHSLANDNIRILETVRHARKLKRGVLAGNQFQIIVRNLHGEINLCEQQLQQIKQHGFPNYFAEQRFGQHGQNVQKAITMFQGASVKREQRAIYFSAARSYLFNLILAARVKANTWRQAIPGDVFKLAHSNSQFHADTIDDTLLKRLEIGDLHPTGLLWGNGESGVSAAALSLEQQLVNAHPLLTAGLKKADLTCDRRALRVIPTNLTWQFSDDTLQLSFGLPAGSYATALLREIIKPQTT